MESKENENKVEEIKESKIEKLNLNEQEIKSTNEGKAENKEQPNNTEENSVESKTIKTEKKIPPKNLVLGAIKRILIVGVLLAIAIFVLDTSKYYKNDDIVDQTNLIINNNNVTSRLKQELIIKNGEIYISMKDLKNFFDNYIYQEPEENKIITTYDENIAEIGFTGNTITLNGTLKQVDAVAIEEDGEIYLPISEMTDVYNIELKYTEETDIVTIDSIKKEQTKAEAAKKLSVKDYAKVLSRTVDKVQEGDALIIISNNENGWTKVRTENGKIGFVKTSSLTNQVTVREDVVAEKQVEEKISMFWDYYSEYASAPDRSGEELPGVNVVSPTFFYIDEDGNFQEKVGTAGINYINWAHENGLKVWPMLSNAEAGVNGASNILKVSSKILNSYELRKELIENIVAACEKYNLDGINIDFEYMYEKDKDMFSRFIIELDPYMKRAGLVTSVDVTAPDGSAYWSLCFDRTVIGDIADYVVFMAYDQYSTSSDTAGTTAGYNWVDTNLQKFIETYEVPSEKIILGIPLYTRIWTETSDGKLSSKVVNMKNVDKNIPEGATKIWDEELQQYYVEYTSGSTVTKMWVEDLESIAAKVSLVTKYNLAGVSAWEKDRESEGTWEIIQETLN